MTDTDNTPPLLAHLERSLGRMDGAWSETAAGGKLAAQILRFPDPTGRIPQSYATLGLSHHVLSQPRGNDARLELLCCALDEPPGWRSPR